MSRAGLSDGLGRRLTPFGGSGICAADRLPQVGLAVGEEASEPDAELRRRDEIGMRDLECGLSSESWEVGCKGAETAMWDGSEGCAGAPPSQFPDSSLLTLR